jgi:hypothetical protein
MSLNIPPNISQLSDYWLEAASNAVDGKRQICKHITASRGARSETKRSSEEPASGREVKHQTTKTTTTNRS